ncbi:LBP_cg2779 family protein [Limosilactobacillus ingluviei]|uniref:LBP_cg2779 family protein n=1 Tax=Limosilactobacillus ingluviei TaxID=148604 RepID=UPI0024B90A09|nr:LBP_cg2779 family protein [Limosilactobacillus ingluviei]
MDESNNLSMEIINFEKEFDLIDNQVAFGSQLSVERVHDIKSQATEEEAGLLRKFMDSQR